MQFCQQLHYSLLELPGLFSGAIIIEQIFNWPGIGSIQLEALNFRDYTVLMAFTMFLSCLTIMANFLADIVYAFVDQEFD